MAESIPDVAPVRSPRVQRTRQRILDAAGDAFSAAGFTKATVEQIATSAGVSKALVYHHFGGKQEIFEGVVERTLADWDDAVRLEDYLAETRSAAESISRAIRAATAYARDRPVVRALFQLEPQLMLTLGRSAPVKETIQRFRQTLTEALRFGIESGELRPHLDPKRSADTIHMLYMALIENLLNPEWIAVDDELIDQAIDLMLHGLARDDR